jgi:hypothetical protein
LTARALSRDPSLRLPGALLLGMRMGWRPTRNAEISITVDNLADRHILEAYSQGPTVAIPIRRTYFVKWTHKF